MNGDRPHDVVAVIAGREGRKQGTRVLQSVVGRCLRWKLARKPKPKPEKSENPEIVPCHCSAGAPKTGPANLRDPKYPGR